MPQYLSMGGIFLRFKFEWKSSAPQIFTPHRLPPLFCARTSPGWVCQTHPLRTHKIVADALTYSLPSPAFISQRRVMMGQIPFALKFLHFQCVYFSLIILVYPFFPQNSKHEHVKYHKYVRRPSSQEGLWFESPSLPFWLLFRSMTPAWTLCECVKTWIPRYIPVHITVVIRFVHTIVPQSVCVWPRNSCTCCRKDGSTLLCASSTYATNSVSFKFVVLSLLYINFTEFGVDMSLSATDPNVTTNK